MLRLRGKTPLILPSLLLCDFGDLKSEVTALADAGIECLHLDVMDGQFVPNLTYGMPIVRGLSQHTSLPLDVHLMILEPEQFVAEFYEAGAASITFHAEATRDPVAVLKQIRALGASAGIAVNPETPISSISNCVGHCDMVTIMSVQAGFGGQSFQSAALQKLEQARDLFGPEVFLEIDGGVNADTISDCVRHGAEMLVVGSAIFRADDYGQAVAKLQEQYSSTQPY